MVERVARLVGATRTRTVGLMVVGRRAMAPTTARTATTVDLVTVPTVAPVTVPTTGRMRITADLVAVLTVARTPTTAAPVMVTAVPVTVPTTVRTPTTAAPAMALTMA